MIERLEGVTLKRRQLCETIGFMHYVRSLRKLLIGKNYSMLHWQDANSRETLNGPVESSIRKKLEITLKPLHCDVINESYMHNVPKGSETHFKVIVVSNKFCNQSLVERHRIINKTLQVELQEGVHALSIVAKTPEQWEVSNKEVAVSPTCRGGFGK